MGQFLIVLLLLLLLFFLILIFLLLFLLDWLEVGAPRVAASAILQDVAPPAKASPAVPGAEKATKNQ